MVNRIGSKRAIANKIIPLFPPHNTFIDMFFGGGGMFFQKPKAKYNICNDLDDDVFNLYQVILNQKDELLELMKIMPISQTLIKYYYYNKEIDPIRKAVRFLALSSLVFFGQHTTMKIDICHNIWAILMNKIEIIQKQLFGVLFMNKDFREVIKSIGFRGNKSLKSNCFIYADPDYKTTLKELIPTPTPSH